MDCRGKKQLSFPELIYMKMLYVNDCSQVFNSFLWRSQIKHFSQVWMTLPMFANSSVSGKCLKQWSCFFFFLYRYKIPSYKGSFFVGSILPPLLLQQVSTQENFFKTLIWFFLDTVRIENENPFNYFHSQCPNTIKI